MVRGGARSLSWAVAVLAAAGLAWLGARSARGPGPLSRAASAYGRGDWTGADASAREALKARPDDLGALRIVARSAARLGRNPSAEAIYRRIGADRMGAEDLFLLGRGLLADGRTGPALASLRAARDADPDHAETLDELARYWASHGPISEAAEAAGRLSGRPGWEARGLARLGPLLRRLGDPGGAAAALAEALRRDPALDRAEARAALAGSLLEAGRPAEAGRALGVDSAPEADWLRSRALLGQGRLAEAEAALKASGEFATADLIRPEPAPFVGSASCAGCHARKYEAEQSSRHARTLVKADGLRPIPWPDRPVVDDERHDVRHEFRRRAGRVEVATRVGDREFAALVEFAIGSNHQGQSFLARDEEGRSRELRVSRYPTDPDWGRTIDHPARPPDDPGYLGRPISASAALACLDCHSTAVRAATEPAGRPEGADRGIGCERCHGPGGNHLRAVALKFSDPAIGRPRLAPAARVMALCGDCHKAPGSASPDEPRFIRFQAPNIERSRCYAESKGALSCVTCHDPHRDADRSAAFYEAKCLSCHAAGPRATAAPCPVRPADDCLRCHMPRVADAVPRSVFTDHHIRIRRDAPR